MSTASNIRQARLAKGFTQEDLARAVGVGVRIVTRWETGKATPRMKTMARIAEATGVTVASLEPAEGGSGAEAAQTRALEDLTAAVMAVLQSATRESREAPVGPPARTRVSALGEPGRPWADPSIVMEMESAGGKL